MTFKDLAIGAHFKHNGQSFQKMSHVTAMYLPERRNYYFSYKDEVACPAPTLHTTSNTH